MSAKTRDSIFIIEADPAVASRKKSRLQEAGFLVFVAANLEEALQQYHKHRADLILMEARLPGDVDGLNLLANLRPENSDLPVILVTGVSNEPVVIRALRPEVRDLVSKSPQNLDNLPEAISQVLRQVRADSQLVESKARSSAIINAAKDAIIIAEANERITLFNPAAEKMFRCSAEQALNKPISQFIPKELNRAEESPGSKESPLTQLLRYGTRGVRANGEEFPLEATVSSVRVGGRKVYTVIVRDITQRQRDEEAIRRSEEQFRQIWEQSLDGMRLTDEKGVIRKVNEAYCRMVGKARNDLEGKLFTIVYAKSVAELLLEKYCQRFSDRSMEPHFTRELPLWNGKKLCFEATNSFLGLSGQRPLLLSIIRDVTDQKKMEEQLRQVQKMESIGQLAGGVAHDFNNLLTVINGYSEVLQTTLNPKEMSYQMVQEIGKAGQRAAALTRQLLAFSRKQILAPQIIDLNALIRDLEKMLTRLISEDISLTTSLEGEQTRIRVDPSQMEQIIINLVVNARDAMPTGGQLTIETKTLSWEKGHANYPVEIPPGSYIMLGITDTGCGMDEATKNRIFEPFFTTKEIGKGTGLGLATVFGIVKQSGGHIHVWTELGRGSSFKIYLPRVEGVSWADAFSTELTLVPRGNETILLVEDEESVRSLACLVLRSSGYSVIETQDVDEALLLSQQYPDPVHLLIVDVVMPRMNGRQLAEKITLQRPKTKVLFISGYTEDAIIRHGLIKQWHTLLQKPFSPTFLAQKVREILDQP